jgi:prevent-host-death family protein
MQISLTELRRTPAVALDHVRQGEEVVVTEAGVPLCRLVPVGRPTRYAELVAAGVIRLAEAPRDPAAIRAQSLGSWGVSGGPADGPTA